MMLARNAACIVLLSALSTAVAGAAAQSTSLDTAVLPAFQLQKIGYPVVVSPALLHQAPMLVRGLSGTADELRLQSEKHAWLWYDDGHALFLYAAEEIRHAIVPLHYTTLPALQVALERLGISDPRFPIRQGVNRGPAYMSGPPVYVDMVLNIAAYLDQYQAPMALAARVVVDIPLVHLPVCDQSPLSDTNNVFYPGMLSLLIKTFSTEEEASVCSPENTTDFYIDMSAISSAPVANNAFDPAAILPGYLDRNATVRANELRFRVRVQPWGDGSGLQLEGPVAQVTFLRNLIRQLDARNVSRTSAETSSVASVRAVLRVLGALHHQLSAPAGQ